MTITRWELYGIVLVLVIAIVGGCAYIATVKNVAGAEAVGQMVKDETGKIREELKSKLDAIAQDKKQVVTPQQIVVKIPEYVPNLPAPVRLEKPSADGASSLSGGEDSRGRGQAPDTPSAGLWFPPEDVKPLFDHLADCKTCDLKLSEMTTERDLQKTRADKNEKAMKGGGFLSRFKSNSKWLIVGGVVGGVAVGAMKR